MFTKRIIPCLDVTGGRVVKGVNFVNLIDAGDPVEIAAAYDKYFRDKRGYTGVVKENIGWKSVPSRRMAKACEEVHYLAVERGYASDPADFWWSKTNHYKGRYEWRFLDVCWTMAVKLELMKRFPMKHKNRS